MRPDIAAAPLAVDVARLGDCRVVVVRGELDVSSTAALRDVLWTQPPHGTVLLDLSGVTFLDAYALRTLVAANRRLRGRGGRLVVTGPQRGPAKVLALTGADRVLDVVADAS